MEFDWSSVCGTFIYVSCQLLQLLTIKQGTVTTDPANSGLAGDEQLQTRGGMEGGIDLMCKVKQNFEFDFQES